MLQAGHMQHALIGGPHAGVRQRGVVWCRVPTVCNWPTLQQLHAQPPFAGYIALFLLLHGSVRCICGRA